MNYIIHNSIVSLLNFPSGILAKIFLSEMSAINCQIIQGEKNLYLYLYRYTQYTHNIHTHLHMLVNILLHLRTCYQWIWVKGYTSVCCTLLATMLRLVIFQNKKVEKNIYVRVPPHPQQYSFQAFRSLRYPSNNRDLRHWHCYLVPELNLSNIAKKK